MPWGTQAWAYGDTSGVVPPGQQTAPAVPGAGSTTYTYTNSATGGGWARRAWGGLTFASVYPGCGIVLVPDAASGVMRVMVWWPDAPTISLVRVLPDGTLTKVRGAYPITVSGSTRRNYATNPFPAALTGYTAGTGTPTLTLVDRGDAVGGQILRGTIASAGTCELGLPGAVPGAATTVGVDVRWSASPTSASVTIAWLNSVGAALAPSTATLTSSQIVQSVGQISRQVVTLTPPTGAVSGTVRVTAAGLPAGGYMDVGRVTLDAATTDGSYVDGDSLGGTWSGTRGLSTSVWAPPQTVLDGECPLDTTVVYMAATSTVPGGRLTSSAGTLPSQDQTWITHPGSPSAPVLATLRGTPPLEYDLDSGVFWPLGSDYPVVVTGPRRRSAAGTVTIGALSHTERDTLLAMFADLQPVLLRAPHDYAGYQHMWIFLFKLTEDPEGRLPWQPTRILTAPFQQVEAPAVV